MDSAVDLGQAGARNGEAAMIFSHLAAATLVIGIATAPVDAPPASYQHLSLQQKNAAMKPFVRSATDCIARKVAADWGFRKDEPIANLSDLIVASMRTCRGPVRAMIDARDRYFGAGSGEAYFLGPFLDVLPGAIGELTADKAK